MLDTVEGQVEAGGVESQIVTAQPKYKMLCILGSHPATVMQTPFDDPDVLIWACSPHNFEMRRLPRFDLWAELHDPIEDPTRSFAYLQYVSTLPRVLMRDQRAIASGAFPGAIRYPEDEIRDKFCPFMLTSSIAYMLAKAIVDCEGQGIRQIGLFGIMQQSETEYRYQRPGIQYMIWEATQRGIKVIAPRESCLFDPPKEKW